jgi:catechol 2,3-dioxygenase-like lactoylglutathione lyase family enzyme
MAAPRQRIAAIAVVIDDYDRAIDYYTKVLGFTLLEDTPQGQDKRWVLVSPPGDGRTNLLLAKASSAEQRSRIGNQTGDRVFLFLHTDDFQRDHAALTARGVAFIEPPRKERYGTVAVFRDLYGNKWDLIQPRR